MAQYVVTRICGHEETVALFGKHRDREWRLSAVEPQKLCHECWQKEVEKKRAEETRLAAEEAKESGLPAMVGTEKQVAWAERIRLQMLGGMEELITRAQNQREAMAKLGLSAENIDAAMKAIQQKTSASWWIDHRDAGAYELAKILQKELDAVLAAESAPPEDVIADAGAEVTVRPEKPVTETAAEIRAVGDMIEVIFPEKRDDFRELVKEKLKMEWAGKWVRKLIKKNGAPADRAAEAGYRLLAAGFVVRIFDEEIRRKAIAGEYKPEYTRWVQLRTEGGYKGWFAINWGRDEDFYKAAKKISGAMYSKPSVIVPPANFEEVLDFAQMYGFKVSDMAQEAAETARRAKEATLTVKVSPPLEQPKVIATSKPLKLEVPAEVVIADEFKD